MVKFVLLVFEFIEVDFVDSMVGFFGVIISVEDNVGLVGFSIGVDSYV